MIWILRQPLRRNQFWRNCRSTPYWFSRKCFQPAGGTEPGNQRIVIRKSGKTVEYREKFIDVSLSFKIVQSIKALRHSLWIRWFSIQYGVGFYEEIHTKQRRAFIDIYLGILDASREGLACRRTEWAPHNIPESTLFSRFEAGPWIFGPPSTKNVTVLLAKLILANWFGGGWIVTLFYSHLLPCTFSGCILCSVYRLPL